MLAALSLSSCQDVIDLDLKKGAVELVVDGMLDNSSAKPDTIYLKWTADYFSNKALPVAAGASVEVNDGLTTFTFAETAEGSGKYVNTLFVGEIGKNYTLNVKNLKGYGFDNETFTATSTIKRVPPIDSLVAELRDDTGLEKAGYYIRYYGPEFLGRGDYYRFKVYVNDTLLNQPTDLSFVNDQFVDGNYISGPEMISEPSKEGDVVKVETLSITEDTYKFYLELQGQIFNGGLFSSPFSNVRTNVVNTNPKSDKKGVGFFRCSGLSEATVTCKK